MKLLIYMRDGINIMILRAHVNGANKWKGELNLGFLYIFFMMLSWESSNLWYFFALMRLNMT